MATRSNRFFNNPEFAAIASNLAGMFAPPSGQEEYGYARASAEREKAARLSELWQAAGGDFDRQNIAAGNYAPTQSYYAVNTADATDRRGQDITAATSRANNLQTNQFGLASDLATTVVGPGDRALGTSILDEDIAAAAGLVPGMSIEGRAAPLSSDQVVAGALQRRIGEDPNFGTDLATNELDVVEILDPQGEAAYAPAGRAAQLGLPVFSNPGGRAGSELFNYRTPDGREGTAVFDPNNASLVDAATGQPLPPNSSTFKLEGGDRAALTGATTSNQTRANEVVAEANFAMDRVRQFRQLLEQNPGIMGIPGKVQSFAQDLGQAATDLVGAFGADGTLSSIEDVQRLAGAVSQRNGYDPTFAQAAALALEMAYMDAKMQDPSGEVNVRELERLLGVYDGGMAGNPRVLGTLDTLETRLQSRRDLYAQQLRDPGGAQPVAPSGPSFPNQGVGAAPSAQPLTPAERRYLGLE